MRSIDTSTPQRPPAKRVGVSLEIAGAIECPLTAFESAWEATQSRSLSLVARSPCQSITRCVRILDVPLHSAGIYRGSIVLQSTNVHIHERLPDGLGVGVGEGHIWHGFCYGCADGVGIVGLQPLWVLREGLGCERRCLLDLVGNLRKSATRRACGERKVVTRACMQRSAGIAQRSQRLDSMPSGSGYKDSKGADMAGIVGSMMGLDAAAVSKRRASSTATTRSVYML
jgi:hypothetical protein